MQARPATRRYTLVQSDIEASLASFAAEVETGLGTPHKSIPCRFLYDEEGSSLFEEICDLPEYYLTRAEREILDTNADDIAEHFADPVTLAELGSGSSSKTRLLIEAFLRRHRRLRYVPVDISASILEESALILLESYPALEVRAIASELDEGLHHVRAETERPKLIAWLGSSIGNLGRGEAAGFLRRVRHAMAEPDRLLVGIDLRKGRDVLEPAYDDAAGVTARFSLNLLERMNRELGGRFDTSAFRHRARWREEEGRVDIALVSLREQRVPIDALELEVEFAEGEPIHVEDSYKYSFEEIGELTAKADLRVERRWLDAAGLFSLNLLSA
jgi:dimethylhistidine N-methyltransferase